MVIGRDNFTERTKAGGDFIEDRTVGAGLNVIGIGPGGEPLENLYDRTGAIPWGDAVRWAQSALSGIEAKLTSIPRWVGFRASSPALKKSDGTCCPVSMPPNAVPQ